MKMVKVQSTKYTDRFKIISIDEWGALQAATKEWVIYNPPEVVEEIGTQSEETAPSKRKAGRPKTKQLED